MNEESLFYQALQQPGAAARSAFLDHACANQPQLRARLEKLLQAHDTPVSLFDKRAVEMDTTLDSAAGSSSDSANGEDSSFAPLSATERPGTRIGPYKLLEIIGQGGMGIVWLAEQEQPIRRHVALKILKAGMDSRQVIARFEQERQALALMDHINIAKVFDAGTTETGWPFFVMELIHGVPITQYCDDKQLTIRERLELFVPVCQAIQHAHQKGVIHRDIKPSNVLVMLCDAKPVPKVIDFGVAKAVDPKLTEDTLFRDLTEIGALIGTLEYMSPEQAELDNLDIDTRSDIYSLGVLLYELLTGMLPLDKKRLKEMGLLKALQLIREEEPPRPSTRLHHCETLPAIAAARKMEPVKLVKSVRGELDWIVMMALEKDRTRRYETVNGLARNVEHYLADEPVAIQSSAGYRLRKLARRHKRALAAAAAVMLGLMVLACTIGYFLYERQTRRIAAEADQRHAIETALDRASELRQKGRWVAARVVLAQARELLGERGPEELHRQLMQASDDLELVDRLESIRLRRAIQVNGHFDHRAAAQDYATAFREAGILREETETVEVVAARIRASAVREQLVAAVDDWVLQAAPEGSAHQAWLLAVARAADSDSWRDRFRNLEVWKDHSALERLARDAEASEIPPQILVPLAALLHGHGVDPVPLLTAAQRRDPSDFWLNFMLADLLQQAKRWEEAIGYYRAAMALRPATVAVYNNLGNALLGNGRVDEAIAEYRKAIELDPKFAAFGHNNIGNALRDKGRLGEAIAEWKKALELDPKLAYPHYNLGLALKDKGRLDEAIAEWKKAIQLDPKLSPAHNNIGVALTDMGRFDEAIAECKMAIQLDPKCANAYNNLGVALKNKGRVDEAITEWKKTLHLDPKHAYAHRNLGEALLRQGRFAEAEAAYREAIRLNPNSASFHDQLAWLLATCVEPKFRNYPQAIELAKRAVQLAPQEWNFWNTLGVAYRNGGQLDEAEKTLREAIRLKADWPSAHYNLRLTLQAKGRLNEAIAEFNKELELEPKHPGNHNDLAWLLATCSDPKVRDPRRAVELAKKAVQLAPQEWNFWNTLGVAYRNGGQLDEAENSFRKAIRLKADWPSAHYNLRLTLQAKGQLNEAIAEFNKELELEPENAGKHNDLAWLLATCPDPKVRDPQRAVELAKKAIKLAPGADGFWKTLGAAHSRSGNWKAAVQALKQAMELHKGGDGFDWFFLAMAYWRLGEKDQARQWYDRAVQWMDKNDPKNDELRRFRSEAAELLGVGKKSK